jgi:hypothetical protein
MTGEQLTKSAFEAMFWRRVQDGLSMKQAFWETNDWHRNMYGHERYASYSSFANSRDQKKR